MEATNVARQTVKRRTRNLVMKNLSQFLAEGSRRIVYGFLYNSMIARVVSNALQWRLQYSRVIEQAGAIGGILRLA